MRGWSGSSRSLGTGPDFGGNFWEILFEIWSLFELSQFVSFCWDGIKTQAILKRKTSKIELSWNILKLDEIKCCFKILLFRKGKTLGKNSGIAETCTDFSTPYNCVGHYRAEFQNFSASLKC